MRLRFQERPWDLYVVFAYLAVMAAVLLPRDVGLLPGILLVLFVPGYVLVAALFPRGVAVESEESVPEESEEGPEEDGLERGGEIDWIERIALSLGLSIAVVPLLGLFLNFTPFGIRYHPIVVTILLFSGGVGAAAYWRRMRLPVEERLSADMEVGFPAWSEYSLLDKVLTVILVASLVVAGSVLVYLATTPRPGEQFTEFYILDSDGRLEDLPEALNVSEEGALVIGVANHEFATVEYAVRVDLLGVEVVFNETAGLNETRVLNTTNLAWFNETLEHDTNFTRPFAFQVAEPGLYQLRLLLYRDGDLTEPYRALHLFLRVTQP